MGSAEGLNMCDLPTPTLFKSHIIQYYYCTCIRKTNFEMKHSKTRIVCVHTPHTHSHARTHTHTHTHHTHIHNHSHSHAHHTHSLTHHTHALTPHTHTHTHTHTHSLTHTHAHTTHSLTHTHTRTTHARAHSLTSTHAHAHTPVKPQNFSILPTRCFCVFSIILTVKSECSTSGQTIRLIYLIKKIKPFYFWSNN